uniref:RxLR effector candidate protein n=1 Tax=Hyaloperonospora arabidopsidis (strain Emoy2) TaxID=559515 RepID=M4BM15_HYAAE
MSKTKKAENVGILRQKCQCIQSSAQDGALDRIAISHVCLALDSPLLLLSSSYFSLLPTMKLIIFDIVAITAFFACAQRPSLVSAALAVPLPVLTASSTPIVAPV